MNYELWKFKTKKTPTNWVLSFIYEDLWIFTSDVMNLYKKCTVKPYFVLVIDATLASDNPLHFRKNLVERIQNLIMTINDKIRDEKLPKWY